jgi:Bacterial Ig-like domain (group 1)
MTALGFVEFVIVGMERTKDMGKFQSLWLAAAAIVFTACSGGSDDSLVGGGPGPGPGGGGAAPVGTLTMLTSSPTLPSDGSSTVTITALVRDSNNNVMENVGVVFSANSGSLVVTQPSTTDANGTVTATLSTGGDPSIRTITVTGLAGGSATATTTITVAGLSVSIDGPGSLATGSQGSYTVRVTDNPVGGSPVPGAAVTVASSAGGAITLAAPTTDLAGEVTFTLTAPGGASTVLTATALGANSVPFTVTISSDSFSFTSPAANTEIDLGTEQQISVAWAQGAGQPISFSTSRGGFTNCAGAAVPNDTVLADGTGNATICTTSVNAGPAVMTATNSANASIQLNVEFVATTPAALELQANPFTIGPNEQSTITSIVRDPAGNLVKNQVVLFNLSDVTGGSLSVAQATTNSQGRAQTIYRASTTTSSVDGVQVTATVQGFPAVTDNVFLTVAQSELFLSIGTGNEIEEPNQSQYRKEWAIAVTDAQGNGVANTSVTFSVLSERYWDGFRTFPLGGNSWDTTVGPPAGCLDEDTLTGDPGLDRNGLLDAGEDNNGNGKIEAGNIATAAAQVGGGGSLVTDANGFGLIWVYWPQEYAYYLEVTLEARTTVQGTEFAETTTFVLDGSATDFNNANVAPPGVTSPFGTDLDCSTPPPPDGP